MIEWTLKREPSTEIHTQGVLTLNDGTTLFTLEDVERDKKIKGRTAIPKGKYEVVFTYSDRFKKKLPLLLNVPGFDGIRIHAGNYHSDTDGCILVGTTRNENGVFSSKLAMTILINLIKTINDKIYINII
jgi:hypothetical protein